MPPRSRASTALKFSRHGTRRLHSFSRRSRLPTVQGRRKAKVGRIPYLTLLNGEEPLHSLAGEYFTCIDIAFRVHADHVQPEELASVFAHAAHLAHNLAIFAVEEPDVVIREIGNIQKVL